MTTEQIKHWLSLLGEQTADDDVTDSWVNTHCPLAPWRHSRGSDRNPSFGVKVEAGESRVWCFSCHFGGTQTSLLLELSRLLKGELHTLNIRAAMEMIADVEEGNEDRPISWDEDEVQEDFVFPEKWLERFSVAYHEGQVHAYLEERGMPYEIAEALDLRYMHSEDRVCFPIRNWNMELVGLHGRAVLDAVQPRYRMITYKGRKNPIAWLGESWIDTTKPVVLAESVFDLARVYQVYRNVACPLTSSMSTRKVERIDRLDSVVTMFDPDEAGNSARRKVRGILSRNSVVSHVELFDDRDPGEMSVYEVAEVLAPLVDLDPMLL